MERRHLQLLGEVMARRKAQLKRVVSYIPLRSKDPFAGPPDPKDENEEAVDQLMRSISLRFDFSLLMSGDRRYTRQLAEEFVQELTKAATVKGLDQDVVRDRVTVLLPWFLRGFRAFNDRLRSSLRILRERPA